MKTRIYVVTESGKKHLIRASSQSAAIAHLTTPKYSATVATHDDIADLVGDGVKVVDASEGE